MSTPETARDQIERVKTMAEDDGQTWDLSDNDRAALRAVLQHRSELLAACVEFVRKCDVGQARSVRSYAQMKAAIERAEGKGQAA